MKARWKPPISGDLSANRFLVAMIGTASGLIVLMGLLYLIWGTGPVIAEIPWYIPMMSAFVANHAMEGETNLKIIPSPSVLETGK
jgi:hypothetical protein